MIFGYSILSLGLSAGLAEVRPDFDWNRKQLSGGPTFLLFRETAVG